MKKKILSGILALTMCFSMMPSIALGGETSEFSSGDEEEFTDEQNKEEKILSTITESYENVSGLNNGILEAAKESSKAVHHTITIQANYPWKIGNEIMFNVKNTHDGYLELYNPPCIMVNGEDKTDEHIMKYGEYCKADLEVLMWSINGSYNPFAPEECHAGWVSFGSNLNIPDNNRIEITEAYTVLASTVDKGWGKFIDNYQEIENPVKVTYDLKGGINGPEEDWVGNGDTWNTDHDTSPTKDGYKFDGWYTEPDGKGQKIQTVEEAISNASADKNAYGYDVGYKKITLYAKWVHEQHSWNYIEDGTGTIKAYCSNSDSQCEYYGENAETLPTLTLQLENLDDDSCIRYSGNAYDGVKIQEQNNFCAVTGKSVTVKYAGRSETDYQESENAPEDSGKYTVKVYVGDSGQPQECLLTADFEITRASINPEVSVSDWTYGAAKQPSVSGLSSEQKDKVTYSYYRNKECTIPTSSENSGAAEDGGIPKNIGTYFVKAEIPATTNYNSGTATGSFAIKPLPVTVKWSDSEFTYNKKEHTVTATITNTLPGDEFKLTYDGNTGTNAGDDYEAKITSLGNPNYSLSDESGNPIAAISHLWKIKPKEVTVTARNLSKHIGNEDPDFENANEKYDVDGLEKDDKIYGVRLERKSKKEDAGTYENDIVVTIDPKESEHNSNYKVNLVNGTFTITDHDWTPEEVVTPATAWSEGMKVKTCKVAECSYHQNGKYYTIPKTGEEDDEYADRIEQYTQITGSDITKAVLNNKRSQFLLSESNVFTPEEKEEIEKKWNNENKAEVWLRITTPSFENNLLDFIRNETKKIAGTEVPDCFFDASLYSKFPGETKNNIKDAGIPINIRIKIPDNMVNKQPYTIRDYKVLRLHQDTSGKDVADILDASFNSSTNEVTFETDKFSIFALTYRDTYYSPSYPVTGIKVSPDSITLTKKDETAQLTAEVTPSYADNKKVTWKSSDEKVATVDENGKVTAVGNGNATITATSVSGSYTATVSVTVKIPVEIEKLTVEPEEITMTQSGETTDLKVKIEPENADPQKLIWETSDKEVVTVDENGKITAVGNGIATVTVTTEDGKLSAETRITVIIPKEIETLTLTAEKTTLTQAGESTELDVKIEPEDADPQKLIWETSDEKVAVVDENGKVTAVGNGTARITVITEDGKNSAFIEITVKIPEKPVINKTTGFGKLKARSVKQTKTSVTLQWNRLKDADGYLIYGNLCNVNGKIYKYKKLATITSGKTQAWTQKGLKKGTFYKYVVKAYKLVDGRKVITDISTSVHTVTQGGAYGIAKSVSVTKIGNKKNTLEVTLKKGQKAQITAKEVKKDNKIRHHRNLCYESSNKKVATVTSKGLIQAKGKGTCKIWVYAQNGVYKELTITVK